LGEEPGESAAQRLHKGCHFYRVPRVPGRHLSSVCTDGPLLATAFASSPQTAGEIKTLCKEQVMSWEDIQANWDYLRESVKAKWVELTDDDLKKVAGRRDWLISMLRERYGLARADAELEIDEFFSLQFGHAG
jgi:uncharacterized protein YjbJ (UPF0337 family)